MQGGFISFDVATTTPETDDQRKKKKLTWYRADIEPCVGTALFLEVPLEKDKSHSRQKSAVNCGKRTLVLNPIGLRRRRSKVNKAADSDED